MRVNEIMTKDVKTVPPTLGASLAWDLMRRDHIRVDRPPPGPCRRLSHRAPHRKRNLAYGVW
jgi:hypothetical protein